jgi:hypothetical protein
MIRAVIRGKTFEDPAKKRELLGWNLSWCCAGPEGLMTAGLETGASLPRGPR